MNELRNKALPYTCLANIGLILITDYIFKFFQMIAVLLNTHCYGSL